MCYSQIWQNFGGDEYLCKLDKEYSSASICKFVVYFLQHSKTFVVSNVFLPLTIAELSTLKQVRFLAHPVDSGSTNEHCFYRHIIAYGHHSYHICWYCVRRLITRKFSHYCRVINLNIVN